MLTAPPSLWRAWLKGILWNNSQTLQTVSSCAGGWEQGCLQQPPPPPHKALTVISIYTHAQRDCNSAFRGVVDPESRTSPRADVGGEWALMFLPPPAPMFPFPHDLSSIPGWQSQQSAGELAFSGASPTLAGKLGVEGGEIPKLSPMPEEAAPISEH